MRKHVGIFSLAAVALFFNACRKSDVPAGTSDSNISSPRTINLIPAQNQSAGDRRIYLPIMQVGTTKATLKTVFDTGSEGMVLSGTSLFTSMYIADTGIVINSPDSAIINGITVTSTKVVSTYGSPPATRSFYGNIAYASFVFGDASGSVQTLRMPFIVIYKGVDNQTQASVPVDANSDGIAGIQSSGFTPGIALVTNRAGVKSPFNYFNYGTGIFAGFQLAPLSNIGWTNQASNQGFPSTPLLTLGLTSDMETGYALQSQRLDIGFLYDPDLLVNVTYGGSTVSNSNLLLDTGTPVGNSIFNSAISGSTTLAAGVAVSFSTNEGFDYGYSTDNLLFQTIVQNNGQQRCIFGIDFFLNNYFLIDYTQHYIGLKAS